MYWCIVVIMVLASSLARVKTASWVLFMPRYVVFMSSIVLGPFMGAQPVLCVY